ncbi:unnamed protein product [Allacma fusca]|uniref:ER lumen protein-retaining receptor n=1 Tax=Allacma fusca TaxID=39272 RepID=A0A8J2MEE3_9HEXA|nr:unnamed protein product [Allacma fusca]
MDFDSKHLYRCIGDGSHMLALLYLALSLLWTRSSRGISGKTQVLFLLTYTLRYMDMWLEWSFISYYNTIVKLYIISMCSLLVYLIYTTNRESYDFDSDNFDLYILIVPVTLLAFLVNYELTFTEFCWTWSIYMEAVALIPQFYMIAVTGYAANSIVVYVLIMGVYRGLHVVYWIMAFYEQPTEMDLISAISGVVETLIAVVGFIIIFSLKLRKCSDYTSRNPSVYTLPHILEQTGKDYKRISPNYPLLQDDRLQAEHEKFVNTDFVGHSYDVTTSGASGYVL